MVNRRLKGGLKNMETVVVRLYSDEIETLKSRVPPKTSMSAYIRKIIPKRLEMY
ncbi:MAG: hypothetical protein H5T36_00545 [Methanobacteriaceae archaeon]|nr:hypothetical protein [Methanobacteriaceae archaeon]